MAAIDKLDDPDGAVMVGDSVYDIEAAARAGVKTIAVLTGGFGGAELREVGAANVFVGLDDVREHIDETPLAG